MTNFDIMTLLTKQYEFLDSSIIQLNLNKAEIFVLDENSIQREGLKLLKRRLLHPFTLSYKSTQKLFYSRADTAYLARYEHNFNSDRIVLRISATDSLTAIAAIKNLQKEIEDYSRLPSFLKVRRTTIGTSSSLAKIVNNTVKIIHKGIQIVNKDISFIIIE